MKLTRRELFKAAVGAALAPVALKALPIPSHVSDLNPITGYPFVQAGTTADWLGMQVSVCPWLTDDHAWFLSPDKTRVYVGEGLWHELNQEPS